MDILRDMYLIVIHNATMQKKTKKKSLHDFIRITPELTSHNPFSSKTVGNRTWTVWFISFVFSGEGSDESKSV